MELIPKTINEWLEQTEKSMVRTKEMIDILENIISIKQRILEVKQIMIIESIENDFDYYTNKIQEYEHDLMFLNDLFFSFVKDNENTDYVSIYDTRLYR
jgi:hypothetical protein